MIYTLSNEYKRQEDQSYDSWLAIVVNQILLDSGIRRIIAFKTKICTLHSAIKRAKGGKPRNRLLNMWKTSTYSLTIYYNEIKILDLEKENTKLKGEKRNLEQSLEMESAKSTKIEEKLNALRDSVEKNNTVYKGKFKQLAKKIAQFRSNKKVRGPAKKQMFKEYTKQHQARIRKLLKDECETALSFLGHYDVVPTRVQLCNIGTGEIEKFCFVEDDDLNLHEEETEICEDEVNNLNMWLYLRWLDTEFHTSFRTSGSPHKPSRDFSMLACPFAMLYCFAVYFCMTRVTCSRQLGVFA